MQIANVGSIEHHNLSLLQALLWPGKELANTGAGHRRWSVGPDRRREAGSPENSRTTGGSAFSGLPASRLSVGARNRP
ncbi:hypothetical protein NL298_27500, partial [Klebsiella pneumoniae]|nr:hypothetical protein [Klebsiella pneumoniae]